MAFAKISEEKISRILELGKENLSTKQIAEEVGVSTGTVSRYLRKATPSHLTGKPEVEGSFSKVLALLETLLQEQRKAKTVVCPVCGFSMYPILTEDNEIPWGCPRCGYRLVSPEPQWRREEEVEEIKLTEV